MHSAKYQKQLERNIGKYSWFKVFNKRVYLPLIAIQLVTVGDVSIEQLAAIAIITSVVQFILQVPAGYIADTRGNHFAIILGCSISAVSPLFYIVAPTFFGGLLASVLFFGGYSFTSGAIEAFMHNTLIALGREKSYAKVMGRAQSYGLIGNVVLIILIPATYSINTSLPFLLGFLSLIIMLCLAISFTYPESPSQKVKNSSLVAARKIVTTQNIALFVFAGFMGGVANRATEYRELLYDDLSVAVALFGLLLAISSITGAIMGRYIHLLDKLKPLSFYFFDLSYMSLCLVAVGITQSPIVAVTGFTLLVGYTRVRMIIFQANLLHTITHSYKATLISTLSLFEIIGEIGAITLLAKMIGLKGYSGGYLLFGFAVFGVGLILWIVMLLEAKRNNPKLNLN